MKQRITTTPGVCGGDACIAGTRLNVWGFENRRRLGDSDADILEDFDYITQDDLDAVWAYVAENEELITQLIAANEAA